MAHDGVVCTFCGVEVDFCTCGADPVDDMSDGPPWDGVELIKRLNAAEGLDKDPHEEIKAALRDLMLNTRAPQYMLRYHADAIRTFLGE